MPTGFHCSFLERKEPKELVAVPNALLGLNPSFEFPLVHPSASHFGFGPDLPGLHFGPAWGFEAKPFSLSFHWSGFHFQNHQQVQTDVLCAHLYRRLRHRTGISSPRSEPRGRVTATVRSQDGLFAAGKSAFDCQLNKRTDNCQRAIAPRSFCLIRMFPRLRDAHRIPLFFS